MKTERDKFLTEQMGECWHEWKIVEEDSRRSRHQSCEKCGSRYTLLQYDHIDDQKTSFSTWEGFGKLWEWAKVHEWWATFTDPFYGPKVNNSALPVFNDVDYAINPDRFADAVYEFLKR